MRATIVYGFLGAGKTTLLRSLVPRLSALESTALLVNEFGIEGVDQVVLASDDLTVRQLVGGCVCCEVRGDLMAALDEIDRRVQPDRLVIEPTGLASPDTLAHVFASPAVRSIVQVDSVITVLDATRYALVRDALGEFFPNQVRHADLVLVNKADAASETELRDARAWARGLNAEAAIVESVYCRVDSDLLLATIRQGGMRMTEGWLRGRPSPQASPTGRGRKRVALTLALAPTGDLGVTGDGCAEDPHPSPLPRGEGARGDAAAPPSPQPSPTGSGRKSGAFTPALSHEGDLGVVRGGCAEDPHPNPLPRGEGGRTESSPQSSPSGEGEERRLLDEVDTAHSAPSTQGVDFGSRVPHDDLAGSGLERLVLDTGDLPAARVDTFVGDLAAGVYGEVVRAKGFVPDAEGCALVDVVLGAWEVREFGPAPLYIDVIGRNLNTNEMELAVTHGIKEFARTA